jgi:uncharacterized membrane protein HdeD (DUF308 family)
VGKHTDELIEALVVSTEGKTNCKRWNSELFGIVLLLAGLYFLGQNIMFSTSYSPYFWRSLPAQGSVLALMGGVISLLVFPRQTGKFGWVLLIFGVVLVFLSGGIMLKPTSLWNFLIAFTALVSGFKLLTEGRLRF